MRLGLSCFAVATLLTAALDAAADLFADFFNEELGAAGWAGLVDRTIPQGKLTGWILTARKEGTSLPRALLHEVSATAWLRALHTQRERLGGLALRIGGAGDKLSKPPGLDDHRTAALLAFLIRGELDLRNNFNGAIFKLLKVLRILAGRLIFICRTGKELAVTPPLYLHHSAALFTGNIGGRLDRVLRTGDGLGTFHFSGERAVKVAHGLDP